MLLHAKESAEAVAESKTRFLAAASHDLRQPLQAAILYAELVNAKVAIPDLRAAIGSLGRLHDVLNDLKLMLDGLFDLSRFETGRVETKIEAVPLRPLIDQVVASCAEAACDKGLSITGLSADVMVLTDRALLSRMLYNLAANAVRYTNSGSVTIASIPSGADARIEVRDTGIGIAPENLGRIWAEFEQVQNAERDRRYGLGLGLAIVRHLGKLLNHRLSVDSRVGVGTCFTITVPLANGAAVDTVAKPLSHDNVLAGEVVVIEDDPAVREVLTATFVAEGLHVRSYADGETALSDDDLVKSPPALLIVDFRLPNKTGAEVIKDYRALCNTVVPAIILTGEPADGSLDPLSAAAELLGQVRVLRKPVARRTLLAAIQEVIPSGSPVDAVAGCAPA